MSTAVFTGKPRRLHWTCRYCGHTFKTYTRRGLRVTCPDCHRVQEGPAGVTRLIDRVQKTTAKPATTLKIVAVNGQKAKPEARAASVKPVKPAAKVPAAPPAPTPAPPKAEEDPILRFFKGGS